MSSIPETLKYTKSHEWVQDMSSQEDGGKVKVGITDYAQEQLGDIVFVSLPEPGERVEAGQSFGGVESVKLAADLYSPVTGTVTAVNRELEDSPELVNDEPYHSWFIEVEKVEETEELLSPEEYGEYCTEEEE